MPNIQYYIEEFFDNSEIRILSPAESCLCRGRKLIDGAEKVRSQFGIGLHKRVSGALVCAEGSGSFRRFGPYIVEDRTGEIHPRVRCGLVFGRAGESDCQIERTESSLGDGQ